MAVIYLEEFLCCFFSPCVYVVFAASAADSAVAAFVAGDVKITFLAVVVKESLRRILAEEHTIYFFDLLWTEQIVMGRFISFPILIIFEYTPNGVLRGLGCCNSKPPYFL